MKFSIKDFFSKCDQIHRTIFISLYHFHHFTTIQAFICCFAYLRSLNSILNYSTCYYKILLKIWIWTELLFYFTCWFCARSYCRNFQDRQWIWTRTDYDSIITNKTTSQVSQPPTLTLPVPCILKSCNKIKINLNFYFHTSLWSLKRFYEGL